MDHCTASGPCSASGASNSNEKEARVAGSNFLLHKYVNSIIAPQIKKKSYLFKSLLVALLRSASGLQRRAFEWVGSKALAAIFQAALL